MWARASDDLSGIAGAWTRTTLGNVSVDGCREGQRACPLQLIQVACQPATILRFLERIGLVFSPPFDLRRSDAEVIPAAQKHVQNGPLAAPEQSVCFDFQQFAVTCKSQVNLGGIGLNAC